MKKTVKFDPVVIDVDDEIKINSTSSIDIPRDEALWCHKSNDLIQKWKNEIDKSIKTHDIKAKKNKMMFNCFSIPTIVLPITASILQPHIPNPLIVSIMMLCAGLFSSLVAFLDFSSKKSKHEIASNSYCEISVNIEEILSTSKRFRTPVDITVRTILLKINAVRSKSPPI